MPAWRGAVIQLLCTSSSSSAVLRSVGSWDHRKATQRLAVRDRSDACVDKVDPRRRFAWLDHELEIAEQFPRSARNQRMFARTPGVRVKPFRQEDLRRIQMRLQSAHEVHGLPLCRG